MNISRVRPACVPRVWHFCDYNISFVILIKILSNADLLHFDFLLNAITRLFDWYTEIDYEIVLISFYIVFLKLLFYCFDLIKLFYYVENWRFFLFILLRARKCVFQPWIRYLRREIFYRKTSLFLFLFHIHLYCIENCKVDLTHPLRDSRNFPPYSLIPLSCFTSSLTLSPFQCAIFISSLKSIFDTQNYTFCLLNLGIWPMFWIYVYGFEYISAVEFIFSSNQKHINGAYE